MFKSIVRLFTLAVVAVLIAIPASAQNTYTATPSSDPVPTGGSANVLITVPLATDSATNIFSSVPAYQYEGALVQVASGHCWLNVTTHTSTTTIALTGIYVAAPATLTFGLDMDNPSNTGIRLTASTSAAAVKVLPLKKLHDTGF